jgi:hypothetical protein
MKSGLYTETLVIRGEYPDELDRLKAEYHREFRPATPRERDLVDSMIRNEWFIRRMGFVETQLWGHHFQKIDSSFPTDRFDNLQRRFPCGQAFVALSRDLERLQRRINALERSNRAALQELEDLHARPEREELAKAEAELHETIVISDPIGFVPSETQATPVEDRVPASQEPEPDPIPHPASVIPDAESSLAPGPRPPAPYLSRPEGSGSKSASNYPQNSTK